jgi:hypothetical protein
MKKSVSFQRRGVSRRAFLRQSLAAAAAPLFIPGSALGLNGHTAPSDRVVVAAIGMGFNWDLFLRRPDTQMAAVCDVRQERREEAKGVVDKYYQNQDCRAYNDFREVLARPDVDAVYIATPDHWHALITIAAARAGKDVYCQKPLTRTIAEGQAVVEAVQRYGTVFQHGTQQRHDARMLFGCELVRNGYIGQLRHVKIGSPAAITCGPQATQPAPAGLDWETWVGPAPWAPFTPLRIQAHPWYHISDYCMGYIAGWGVHHADSAAQGSGVDDCNGVIGVDAFGLFPADGLFDNAYRWQIGFTFPGGLTWHWTDCEGDGFGSRGPADWPQNQMGIRFEGSEGWVFIWRGVVDAHPKSLLNVKIGRNDKVRFNRPGGEPQPDFIECVRRRLKTCAPVEIAHRSTNLCALGAIGMVLNRKLTWDTTTEQFQNDEEANRLRARAMRQPWRL